MNKMTNVAEMFNRTDELIEWLTQKGISTASFSRIAQYKELGAAFFTSESPSSPDAIELFTQLTKSIYEFILVLLVKDTFENENSPGFLERLKSALKGKTFIDNAKEEGSRNFLFELLVAVFFARKGYKIEFTKIADIIAYRNNTKIYIECKKCYSDKKIEKNLKYAHKQLTANISQKDFNTVGLVALDISHLSDKHIPKCEFPNQNAAQAAIKSGIRQVMKDISWIIDKLNTRFINSTLATLVFSDNMFWLDDISVFLHQDLQVIAAKELNDAAFAKLNSYVV